MKTSGFPPRGWRPALPLLLLVIVILAWTANEIRDVFVQQRDKEAARLQTIADLKSRQIVDWLRERQGDAEFVQTSQFFATNYRRWRESGDLASRDLLQTRMEQLRRSRGFAAIMLLDEQGKRLLGSARSPLEIAPPLRDAVKQAAADRQVRRVGPYRGLADSLRLDFVAPLTAAGSQPPLIVLHIDPHDWLFHTLQSWPVPSASGETLLFRRDGDQVLFLNELRHRRNTAVKLRVPLATSNLLAAQVLRGEVKSSGLIAGEDYRGMAVLGVAHPIPGTDWFLVAKLDRTEIYAEATKDSLWIGFTGLLALFVAVAGYYLVRQRQQLTLSTSVQQSQAERLHALQLLAAIADSSNDAIFAKDGDGRYTLYNRAAGRMTGIAPETALGLDDRAIFPTAQAAAIRATDQKIMAADKPAQYDEVIGTQVVEVIKGPLHDENGQAIGIFGIARNVTERKQAESALRASEAKFRSLFENSMDGVLLTTPDGSILSANPEAQRIFGYSEDELRGIGRPGVVDTTDHRLGAALAEREKTGQFRGELTLLAKDGTRFPAEVSSLVFEDSHGQAMTSMVVRDIGARIAAERALLCQTEELRSRNAELERFNRAMVGRELDMLALKQQVNALSVQLGQEPPYPLAFLDTQEQPPERAEP